MRNAWCRRSVDTFPSVREKDPQNSQAAVDRQSNCLGYRSSPIMTPPTPIDRGMEGPGSGLELRAVKQEPYDLSDFHGMFPDWEADRANGRVAGDNVRVN